MSVADVSLRVRWSRTGVEGDRRNRALLVLLLLCGFLLVCIWLSMTSGAVDIRLWEYLQAVAGQHELSARDQLVIEVIRLPRMVLGVIVGGGLAIAGAVMQGLFRNPLADPGVVGVSAGASLGAAAMIVLGSSVLAPVTLHLGIYALPVAAFVGSLATTFCLYSLGRTEGQTSVATLLLAGIALSALALAMVGVLIFLADDQQLRDLNFWQLGSLAGATWGKVAAALPFVGVASLGALLMAPGLNSLFLGEAAAGHMGIHVERLKTLSIICVALATGACVAVSGGIGFVGIVVPHLLRLVIGPDHRYLLPGCVLLGASLLLLADAIARVIVAPAELPIGIVTALVGAPFFLWILLRRKGLMAGV
ncbi:iron ABC transporter permease [Roseibium sp. CAU 1637]|uniref:Iron ABC transporter permease n=1 Tax=Roseibium limicola TaxID=2816037 RepID=A0A939J7U3_9HYPH|nr:iron ABC transporter permease [Roseibium limicola]MBO0344601.1 iron ABC transporter permease [Roseibium limicola]